MGGGIQNRLLNQMAADATGLPTTVGPIEGAALGNALMQAQALGLVKDTRGQGPGRGLRGDPAV